MEEQKSGGIDSKTAASTGRAQKTSRGKVNEDKRVGGDQEGKKRTAAASVEKEERTKEQGESEQASRASPKSGDGRSTAGSGESSKTKKKRPRKEDASNVNEGRKIPRHDDDVPAAGTVESPSIGDGGISVAIAGASIRTSSKGQKGETGSTASVSKMGESRGKGERDPVSVGVPPPKNAPAKSIAVGERGKSTSKADRLKEAGPGRNEPRRVDGKRRPMEVDRCETDTDGNGVGEEAASKTDASNIVQS